MQSLIETAAHLQHPTRASHQLGQVLQRVRRGAAVTGIRFARLGADRACHCSGRPVIHCVLSLGASDRGRQHPDKRHERSGRAGRRYEPPASPAEVSHG